MQRVVFGTDANNQLTLNGPGNLLGFAGNDTLVASNAVTTAYSAFMLGGEGNDHYIANSLFSIILDTAGNDTVTLPGSYDQYATAYVDGQGLTLVNTFTDYEVVIYDAKGRGRIETFRFESGEVFSGEEMEQRVYSEGYGDITYAEYDSGFSAQYFQEVKEINKAWADLDWNGVWQSIAQRGDVSSEGVGAVLDDAITALLSPGAQQQWLAQGGPEQLRANQYEGVEQHLPATPAPSPVLPREVVENIALIYEAALNRQPDESGVNYWIDVALQGKSTIDISGFFIQSEEFKTNFSVANDEDFVDRMYLNVLDRNADAAGKAYWLDQMSAGLTQAEVLNYFAVSEENIDNATWLSGLAETDNGWVI